LLPTSTPYFFIYLCAHFPRGNGSRGTRFCSVESFMLPLLDTSSASERAPPPPRTVSKKTTEKKHGAWTIRMCVNHSHAHARSVVRFTIFAAPVCLYYSSTGFEEGAVGLLRRCHRRWPRVLLEVLRRAHTVPSIVTSCSCTQKTASGSRAQKLCSSVERARERARASEREREGGREGNTHIDQEKEGEQRRRQELRFLGHLNKRKQLANQVSRQFGRHLPLLRQDIFAHLHEEAEDVVCVGG
jgi:hypothetical protein